MTRKFDVSPSQLDKVRAKKSSFDAATEKMTSLIPLLYQSGYIAIKGYDKISRLYELDILNNEIRVGLFGSLLPHYLERFQPRATQP